MSRPLRLVGIAVGAMLVLLLVAAATVYAMSERVLRERHMVTAAVFERPLPTDPDALAEGERMARTRTSCFHPEEVDGVRAYLLSLARQD